MSVRLSSLSPSLSTSLPHTSLKNYRTSRSLTVVQDHTQSDRDHLHHIKMPELACLNGYELLCEVLRDEGVWQLSQEQLQQSRHSHDVNFPIRIQVCIPWLVEGCLKLVHHTCTPTDPEDTLLVNTCKQNYISLAKKIRRKALNPKWQTKYLLTDK